MTTSPASAITSITLERRAVLDAIAEREDAGAGYDHIVRALLARTGKAPDKTNLRQLVHKLRHQDKLIEKAAHGHYVAPADVRRALAALPAGSTVTYEHGGPAPGGTAETPASYGDGSPWTARSLPVLDLRANAAETNGNHYLVSEKEIGRYIVDPTEIAGLADGEGFVTTVYGTSMEGDFRPGDRVICKRYRGGWAELVDGHYLLRMDDVCLIKTLQRLPGRRLRIVSSNAAEFPPIEVDLRGLPDDAMDLEAVAVVYAKFKRYW